MPDDNKTSESGETQKASSLGTKDVNKASPSSSRGQTPKDHGCLALETNSPHHGKEMSRSVEGSSDTDKTLWVRDFTRDTSARDIKSHLEKHGKVQSVKIVRGTRISNKSKIASYSYFGVVILKSGEDVEKCIKYLNNSELKGKTIVLQKTVPDSCKGFDVANAGNPEKNDASGLPHIPERTSSVPKTRERSRKLSRSPRPRNKPSDHQDHRLQARRRNSNFHFREEICPRIKRALSPLRRPMSPRRERSRSPFHRRRTPSPLISRQRRNLLSHQNSPPSRFSAIYSRTERRSPSPYRRDISFSFSPSRMGLKRSSSPCSNVLVQDRYLQNVLYGSPPRKLLPSPRARVKSIYPSPTEAVSERKREIFSLRSMTPEFLPGIRVPLSPSPMDSHDARLPGPNYDAEFVGLSLQVKKAEEELEREKVHIMELERQKLMAIQQQRRELEERKMRLLQSMGEMGQQAPFFMTQDPPKVPPVTMAIRTCSPIRGPPFIRKPK